jgi:hypothetical protein
LKEDGDKHHETIESVTSPSSVPDPGAKEPPWEYRVEDGTVHLDVMGDKSAFPLAAGPRAI